MKKTLFTLIILAFLLASCSPAQPTPPTPTERAMVATEIQAPPNSTQTPTPTFSPTITPTPNSTLQLNAKCEPVQQGYTELQTYKSYTITTKWTIALDVKFESGELKIRRKNFDNQVFISIPEWEDIQESTLKTLNLTTYNTKGNLHIDLYVCKGRLFTHLWETEGTAFK